MAPMVANAGNSASDTLAAEKSSRNKRKFRADPPPDDPNNSSSLSDNDLPLFQFPSQKTETINDHNSNCKMCTSHSYENSNPLKSIDENPSLVAYDAVDWGYLTVTELENIVLNDLDTIFKSAINKIIACGYSEEVVTKAVLRPSVYYGPKDISSNIIDNALLFIRNKNEIDPSKEHFFEKLEHLEKFVLGELVSIFRAVNPAFSVGDALWILLLNDMNIKSACSLVGGSSSGEAEFNFSACKCKGNLVPEKSISLTDNEIKSVCNRKSGNNKREFVIRQKAPHLERSYRNYGSKGSSRPGKHLTSFAGLVLDKKLRSISESVGVNVKNATLKITKTTLVDKPQEMTTEKGKRPELPKIVSQEKIETNLNPDLPKTPFQQKMETNSNPDQKMEPNSNSNLPKTLQEKTETEFDSDLPKTPFQEEEETNSNPDLAKTISQEKTNSDLPKTLLQEEKETNSTSDFPKTPFQEKSETNSTSDSPKNPFEEKIETNSSSDLTKTIFQEKTNSGSPKTLSQEKKETNSTSDSPKTPSQEKPGTNPPSDSKITLFQEKNSSGYNKRDAMLMLLLQRKRTLQEETEQWDKWANLKVMQAAKRLGKDKAELRALREEREERERVRRESRAAEENTKKKVMEMEGMMRKTLGEMEWAKGEVRRLEGEGGWLRREMELARERAEEAAARGREGVRRENEAVGRVREGGREKGRLQEEMAAERRKVVELEKEMVVAKEKNNQYEVKWKQEEKAKKEILKEAASIRREREVLEAWAKAEEETIKSNAETNLQKYKDDIAKLEKEISELRIKNDSSKIAELRKGAEPPNPEAHNISSLENKNPEGVKRERECAMCLSEERIIVFLPCAHQVLCKECNEIHEKQGVKDCPSCRTIIQQRICVRYASKRK